MLTNTLLLYMTQEALAKARARLAAARRHDGELPPVEAQARPRAGSARRRAVYWRYENPELRQQAALHN
ncbi:hypothetical protein [Ferrovibrio sp.]|uniref:hypothetical protein n=1 Tax=Ferrovibrio sp. TaxID=1917215 RepID=UPI00260A13E2|nr:hypothetical protein [Ferrovibrio sp.]